MTDVHGEPQQGGYLPAEIWHDYMAAVTEGQPCVPFPEPKEPISYQPFFGKFASDRARRRPAQEAAEADARRSKKHHARTPVRARTAAVAAAAHRKPATRPTSRARARPPAPTPTGGPAGRARRRRREAGAEPSGLAARHAGSLRLSNAETRAAPNQRVADQMGQAVAKEDKVEFEGEVIEALPNAMFRVKLDNDHVVLGHVAGKMRRFRIRILPGDRVRCELSPYDLDRARIVYRHR